VADIPPSIYSNRIRECLNRDFDKIFRIHKINPANLENLVGIVVQDKKPPLTPPKEGKRRGKKAVSPYNLRLFPPFGGIKGG